MSRESDARPPLVRFLDSFLQERNIKWMLGIGLLTVFGSSLMLVTSHWQQYSLEQAGRQSAFAQFARLEERVERADALDEAWDRLEGRDPDAEELQRRFEAEERREQVENELEDLKRRLDEE